MAVRSIHKLRIRNPQWTWELHPSILNLPESSPPKSRFLVRDLTVTISAARTPTDIERACLAREMFVWKRDDITLGARPRRSLEQSLSLVLKQTKFDDQGYLQTF